MKLSELIAEIGDENVRFQFVSQCLKGNQQQCKDHVSMTVGVAGISLMDLVSNEPSQVGMILWLPGDKFREIQKRLLAK